MFKAFLIEKRSALEVEWSVDDWADAFWELLETSVPHTLCGQACPDILNDTDRWAEAVEVALRVTTEVIVHRVDTSWTHKYIIA